VDQQTLVGWNLGGRRRISREESTCEKSGKEKRRQQEKNRAEKEIVLAGTV